MNLQPSLGIMIDLMLKNLHDVCRLYNFQIFCSILFCYNFKIPAILVNTMVIHQLIEVILKKIVQTQ